jgi:hypothetical protein
MLGPFFFEIMRGIIYAFQVLIMVLNLWHLSKHFTGSAGQDTNFVGWNGEWNEEWNGESNEKWKGEPNEEWVGEWNEEW